MHAIPLIVWVFLVGLPGHEIIHPEENFDTQQTCKKFAAQEEKRSHVHIRCVRLFNK